jgi:hypothetical protein
MTLKTWLIFTYPIVVGLNAITGFLTMFAFSGSTFWVYFMILCFYMLALVVMWKGSEDFRKFVKNVIEHDGV